MASPVTDQLRSAPPSVHGDRYFGLEWPALRWLERHLRSGMVTLETGSGGSSIVFAASGCRHTVISPAAGEHEAIRDWCAERAISTRQLTFIAEPSDIALAGSWKAEPLDLVLIDGAHGFPYPALDWFLTAPHLKRGGHVLVDDAFLPSVNSLVRYLGCHPDWSTVPTPGYRTAIFRKEGEGISHDWVGSRYDRLPRFGYLPIGRRMTAFARHMLIDRSEVGQRIVRLLRRG